MGQGRIVLGREDGKSPLHREEGRTLPPPPKFRKTANMGIQIELRIPPAMLRRIDDYCKPRAGRREELTRNQVIKAAIEDYLATLDL
jgi:hypothetical protein